MEVAKETLLTGYPNVISYDCSKKIITQMEKYICKIKVGNEQATGFFCKIPFPNKDNMLPVLMTNNHAINENILNTKGAKISVDIYEELNTKYLNLNDRIKYTNETYDTTIIEIKEADEIKNYLELDDNITDDIINNQNRNDKYKDETVYIIQYPDGKLSVSYGVLCSIYEDKKYNFIHKCSTKHGSSGSPILNLTNNKIIGIHKEGIETKFNRGTFINYPIKEFINQKYSLKLSYNNNIHNLKIDNNISQSNIDLIMQAQAKLSICKIVTNKSNTTGTGFLCLIALQNIKKIPVLITNIIQSKMDTLINISFDNESTFIDMALNQDRIIFSESEYKDITIIEIKNEDKDMRGNRISKSYKFLELDENAMNPENFKDYNEKDAYMVKYCRNNKGDFKTDISIGKIIKVNNIYDKHGEIIHQIDSGMGSMGSPILNLKTSKVFGMHLAKDKYKRYGRILYFAVTKFKEQYILKNK